MILPAPWFVFPAVVNNHTVFPNPIQIQFSVLIVGIMKRQYPVAEIVPQAVQQFYMIPIKRS